VGQGLHPERAVVGYVRRVSCRYRLYAVGLYAPDNDRIRAFGQAATATTRASWSEPGTEKVSGDFAHRSGDVKMKSIRSASRAKSGQHPRRSRRRGRARRGVPVRSARLPLSVDPAPPAAALPSVQHPVHGCRRLTTVLIDRRQCDASNQEGDHSQDGREGHDPDASDPEHGTCEADVSGDARTGSRRLGFATERAMASEKLGVVGTASKELKGRRSGTATILRFDDGTRATVTFAVRGK